MQSIKDKRGFTLVEVLIVVAIIGILAVVSLPNLVQNIDSAKVSRIITKYDAFKTVTINNINTSEEVNLNPELIETITNEVLTVPDKTPIGGKYILTNIESEEVKCLDEEGNPLKDATISWQVALGIVESDSDIYITDKQIKQLVKTLGNTNVVIKEDEVHIKGIYIKIVD